MVIVLICRSFVKVLGNPGCALGLGELLHYALWDMVHLTLHIHSLYLLNSKLYPQPLSPYTHDSACENLVDLPVACGLAPPFMIFWDRGCIFLCALVAQSCPTLYDPHGRYPARFFCSWNSPGKNIGVGSYSLLQGIFPTQGLNLGLLQWRFFTVWATWEALIEV